VREGPALALELRGSENGSPIDHAFLAQAISQALHHEREARSAARELTERYEEINLLYFISEILGSMLSVPDAATRILGEVTVFSWPGTGFLLNTAIFRRDIPILQGSILVLALFFVCLNVLVDLLQTMIDPRIRRG
jgi:ABC-type microcin C transport system permease subunit YejB